MKNSNSLVNVLANITLEIRVNPSHPFNLFNLCSQAQRAALKKNTICG
jgi:hypothetical protein